MSCTIRQAYNNTAQSYTAAGTTINILGTICTKYGCNARIVQSGFQILRSGKYKFSFDVTTTPSSAGAQILQLYKDGVALPCAITTDTVAASGIITQHIETTLNIDTCCAIQPIITARLSGVAGTENFVRATLIQE